LSATSTPITSSTFSAQDSAFALFIITSWGLNFVVMTWGLASFSPFQLGAARYVLAAFPLVFFLKPQGLPWRWVLIYGLTQGVGQFGFLFTAIHLGMTASIASVLMQTQVFFTALLAMALLQERLKREQWLGLALAAGGLLCFAMHLLAHSSTQSVASKGAAAQWAWLALLLNLAAAASWALSNIVARKAQQDRPGYDALSFIAYSSLVPILPFVLLSHWFDGHSGGVQAMLAAPWRAWATAAYLGWVATIAAYAMWTTLLKRHAASRVAPLSLGVPVVGVAAGMLLLGERISAWQWTGIALVLAAMLISLFGARLGKNRASPAD
jgi:O-acetylserine/cysteine efflux transporter